jgi:acyl-homoserine lactone acylase PvdQ
VALLADRGGLAPPDIPDANLLAALQSAAAKLRADWGGLEVPYGRVFRIRREGGTRDFPLGGGSVPGMATPRAVSFRRQPDGKTFVGTGGQTATQIVHLTKTPESFSLLPLGESDDPASPHFDDQAEKLMSPQRLKPTYFLRKQKLLQHVEFTTTIEYLPR